MSNPNTPKLLDPFASSTDRTQAILDALALLTAAVDRQSVMARDNTNTLVEALGEASEGFQVVVDYLAWVIKRQRPEAFTDGVGKSGSVNRD